MPLTRQDALELRFNGPIPAHLKSGKTEAQHMMDHHRCMIRFSQVRVSDFTESLERLLDRKEKFPDEIGLDAWISRTRKTIQEHRNELERHQEDLAVLMGAEQMAAE